MTLSAQVGKPQTKLFDRRGGRRNLHLSEFGKDLVPAETEFVMNIRPGRKRPQRNDNEEGREEGVHIAPPNFRARLSPLQETVNEGRTNTNSRNSS